MLKSMLTGGSRLAARFIRQESEQIEYLGRHRAPEADLPAYGTDPLPAWATEPTETQRGLAVIA